MSEKSLRSKIIRLAHSKPELREHLLPLVTKTSADKTEKYMCFTESAQDDIDAACIKAGLNCKLYRKKIVGYDIPHIEISGDSATISKIMKKFKDVSKKV